MSYLALLNACAQVVGGDQPTLAQMQAGGNGIDATKMAAQQPFWYSGTDAGTVTGVAGLVGCYSLPTEVIGATPVAMVLPDGWSPLTIGGKAFPVQGRKYRKDLVHVRVLVGNNDMQTLMAQLVNFADLVPTAFDTHMQLFATANVSTADCSAGRFLEVEWGGTAFFAVEFTISIDRAIPVTRAG